MKRLADDLPAQLRSAQAAAADRCGVLASGIRHAVASAPEWLHQQWFRDDLVDVAVGYVRTLGESGGRSA